MPLTLKKLSEQDDADALLLTAKAYEQGGDSLRALAAYRRLYFYAPVSATNDAEASAGISRLNSTTAPATVEEAVTRAEKLFQSKRHADAVAAYADAFGRFPETATPQAQLRRGIAAYNARRAADTIAALTAVPISAGDTRAEALYNLVQHYARAKQWDAARSTVEEMRRAFPANAWTMRALVAAGQTAKDGRSQADALYFDRLAVQMFAGAAEVAGAQFETAWAAHDAKKRADQLSVVGLDDLAHDELDKALESAPSSPRVGLAKARIYRSHDDNLQAFNVLRKSYPDYSQMEPEELTREEWDVFYPLGYWNTITLESRAKSLDPYTVAGLIRQESVFNPRAVSGANAYGLMQLLPGTARLTAKTAGVESAISNESLFDPVINIKLGTTYLRSNLDKFGRIEYVAAAYNAGPGRAVQWRATLPLQIDEWVEAIPFRETRGYVQGVVRNTLQYRRLYDEQGRFRPEVGTRAVRPAGSAAPTQTPNEQVRPRRVSGGEEEEVVK
ncbi:MAG: transglycosylase SLT domain-containing protein [Acidobacteria bacterium]|nr:transglycosylase SLT domain-containing protein [Acidobacteriota bacterium]